MSLYESHCVAIYIWLSTVTASSWEDDEHHSARINVFHWIKSVESTRSQLLKFVFGYVFHINTCLTLLLAKTRMRITAPLWHGERRMTKQVVGARVVIWGVGTILFNYDMTSRTSIVRLVERMRSQRRKKKTSYKYLCRISLGQAVHTKEQIKYFQIQI